MPDIRLVCLDFDGTIMTYEDPLGFFHPAIVERLNELPGRGIRWCTNSGRDFANQVEIIDRSVSRGLRAMPDGLICAESYLYGRRNGRYEPDREWNEAARETLSRFHASLQGRLRPALADLQDRYQPEKVVLDERATVFCVPDEEAREGFAREFRALVGAVPGGQVTANGPWIVALPVELGKGPVLAAYMRTLSLQPEQVLAVGDHNNDLSMLDGSAARHAGCPSDAMAEVTATVRRAGGRVADAEGPLGTLEILDHYLGV